MSKSPSDRNLLNMAQLHQNLTALVLGGALFLGCASSGSRGVVDADPLQLQIEAAGAALSEGDPTAALQILQAVEKDASRNAGFFHVRALAYAAKKDLASAVSNARRAVQVEPQFSDARNSLGKFLIDQGRLNEAKPELLKAAQDPLYRDAFKSYTLLGIAQYRLGELDAARGSLAQAVQADSGRSCLAHYYTGHIAMKQGKLNEALKAYDDSTKRFCVAFADGQLAYGIALKRTGQNAQARRTFLSLRERFPKSTAAEQALIQLKGLP